LYLTVERILQERKQLWETSSAIRVVDDAGPVRRISADQNKHALRDEVPGAFPYRKAGHLLRFDFDEIVEWTKDKEK
jgi:hypothetical protein